MPDFGDLEKEAQAHSQQMDEGIQKADQYADEKAGGRDKGLIDKAAQEAEDAVGGAQQPPAGDPDAPQSPA